MISTRHIDLDQPSARQLRYRIMRLNFAADAIIPSLAADYETWGFLHQSVDDMTIPTSDSHPFLNEPAYYANLAATLRRHHDQIQKALIDHLLPAARGTHVRDRLSHAAQDAEHIARILSQAQLNQYHRNLSHRPPGKEQLLNI